MVRLSRLDAFSATSRAVNSFRTRGSLSSKTVVTTRLADLGRVRGTIVPITLAKPRIRLLLHSELSVLLLHI